jgi:U3 small nucleolar RNA-associated protein 23
MEWRRLLPKALQVDASNAHFHVTQCVVAELESLGAPAAEALRAARTLPLLKCREKHGHGEACSPRECASRLVGADNAGKWVVVTQDAELRDSLRAIPGVPLMLISTNVLILEAPSPASRAAGQEAEGRKSALAPGEALAVKRLASGGGEGGASSASGAKFLAGKKKRKGPKQPNPLSQQKKKRPPPQGLRGLGSSSTASGSGRRKQRSRKETQTID